MKPLISFRILVFLSGLLLSANLEAQIYFSGVGNTGNGGGVIGEYTLGGSLVTNSLITGLTTPDHLAISGSDIFFVNAANTIEEYTTSGTAVNASLISGTHFPSDGLGGLAVSGSLVYVASSTTQGSNPLAIAEYTTSGSLVNANFISAPNAVLGFTLANNTFYVSNLGPSGKFAISTYNLSGSSINSSFVSGPGGGNGLDFPTGLAVSGTDLFASNGGNSTITEYNAITGAQIGSGTFVPQFTGLSQADDIRVFGSGLYVDNSGNNNITQYSLTTGGTLQSFAPSQGTDGQVFSIAVVPEPSTWALMPFGAMLVFILRRKLLKA